MTIIPKLIVSNTAQAIAFYRAVFGAEEIERFALANEQVVHTTIRIGDSTLALADEAPDWGNPAPTSLGGSPVLLTVEVDAPDETSERAVEHGATVVIAVADQFYGKREGRIRDPFGHLWILSKQIKQLTEAQIAQRMREWDSGRKG